VYPKSYLCMLCTATCTSDVLMALYPRALVKGRPLQPRMLSTTDRQPREAAAAQAHLT
jgi:hypothetical protein